MLFILDPEEGNIIGVLSLQCSILGLATSGGHIFLMCQATNSRKIIKLSIHPSLVKLRSNPLLNAGRFAGNLSAASSRAGSHEALDQIHIDRDGKNDGTASPKLRRAGREKEERALTEEGQKAVQLTKVEEKPPAVSSSSSGPCKESAREGKGEKDSNEVELVNVVGGSSEEVEKDGVTSKEMTKDRGVAVEETAALVERQKEAEENEVKSEEIEKESLEAKQLADVDISQTESEQVAVKTTPGDENNRTEREDKPGIVDTTTIDLAVPTGNSEKLAKADGQTSPMKKEPESEKESSSIPEQSRGKSIIPTLVLAHGISHVKADLKEIKGALKLGKLTEFISQATHHSPTLQRKSDQHTAYSVSSDVVRLSTDTQSSADQEIRATPTTVAPLTVDPEEQQRRLRMAEMVEQDDEDIVVATKSQTKARKTRKRRTKKSSKHSSAASK